MCKVPNEKLNFPEALTDEELCRLVAEGNRQAEEILAARYIGWFAPVPARIFWQAVTVRT